MKSLLFIVIALLFCCAVTQAQNKKIDSLNTEIAKATSDTTLVRLMIAKAYLYANNNLDSSLAIAEQAAARAKKIHFASGEASAYQSAAVAHTYKGAFGQAYQLFKEAEKIFIRLKDSAGANTVLSNLGMYYGVQSKYDSSIYFFQKSLDYKQRHGTQKELTKVYQNIAVSYTMQSNFGQALYYQKLALQLAETNKDTGSLAFLHLNLGINYSNISDFERSEMYSKKAVLFAKRAQLKNVELYAYSNLASVYQELKQYKLAYDYATKAVDLGKQLGDYGIVATLLAKAGYALAAQQQFARAEQLGNEAVALADSVGVPINIHQTLVTMGSIKRLQKDFAAAVTYYEKGLAALDKADMFDEQVGEAYRHMAESYEQTGKYQQALAAFKMSTTISDSIHSRENVRKTTELGMNYDFEKKEQAMKAEQERKDAVAGARQMALLVGLGLTVLLIAVVVIAYRSKQKANVALHRQKMQLEATLAELKAAQKQLIQSEKMASLGELTAGIAHEIQNPLNFVNNFSEVSEELLNEAAEEAESNNPAAVSVLLDEVKQNLRKIVHHGKRADAIVKGMLQHSRKSSGQKEPTDLNALAAEYLRLSYHGLRAKDSTFTAALQHNFDEQLGKVNVVQQDVGRVLLNLFTNALHSVRTKQKKEKAGSYEPVVQVSTKRVEDGVEIRVRDNGDGIPDKLATKIFQPFFTTKPTGEGTGLGLSLSYDIITNGHGGTITVNSVEGEFAEFIITLPA